MTSCQVGHNLRPTAGAPQMRLEHTSFEVLALLALYCVLNYNTRQLRLLARSQNLLGLPMNFKKAELIVGLEHQDLGTEAIVTMTQS